MTDVKICGLSDEASVEASVSAGANYVGFVYFPPSPRHISIERAAELQKLLPRDVFDVLVMVDPENDFIEQLADGSLGYTPKYIQLHGHESPERVQQIFAISKSWAGPSLIKAIPVETAIDINRAIDYMPYVDMILFDAKPPQKPEMLPGGNGISFQWSLMKGRGFDREWMLSGGLHVDNVREAIRQSGAKIVDVSSSVESSPGVKDVRLIHEFVNAAKK